MTIAVHSIGNPVARQKTNMTITKSNSVVNISPVMLLLAAIAA